MKELEGVHIHALFSDMDMQELQDCSRFLAALNERLETQIGDGQK